MSIHRFLFVAPVFFALAVGAIPAAAQPANDAGVLSLIPADAMFFFERRGHRLIRPAFMESNFEKIAHDGAIQQMLDDSRVAIGQMIADSMFEPEDEEQLEEQRQLLHEFLKPFWYEPSAAFMVLDEKNMREGPGFGFVCLTGQHERATRDAIDALMDIGVPAAGEPGTRQAFTYKTGAVTWTGVAKNYYEDFSLPTDKQPDDEALAGKTLFMVSWQGSLLCVATDLSAARSMAAVLEGKAKGKDTQASVKAVLAKTKMKDWAFRWHIDVEGVFKLIASQMGESGKLPWQVTLLGVDKIRGIGGTEGYLDKVVTRLDFLDAPGAPVRFLKANGSYAKALKMLPSESVIMLAGQFDLGEILRIAKVFMMGERPATAATDETSEMPDEMAALTDALDSLVAAGTGDVGIFVTDIQSIMAMGMGEGGAPVGFILGIEDKAKARVAVDKLAETMGGPAPDPEAPQAIYRKVPVRVLHPMLRVAILDDRMIVAMGTNTMRSAIDTALDDTGSLEPGSDDEKLAKLAGDGSMLFAMDLKSLANLGWPMLVQMAEGMPEYFPLRSLPSTGKMTRLLGRELAVLKVDPDGLMINSRGRLPLAMKIAAGYPMAGAYMLFSYTVARADGFGQQILIQAAGAAPVLKSE